MICSCHHIRERLEEYWSASHRFQPIAKQLPTGNDCSYSSLGNSIRIWNDFWRLWV